MKYAVLPRRVTLLVFGEPDSINYTSSCQINIYGDRGVIDTLNGRDFYRLLAEEGLTPFVQLGLRSISAGVSKAHCRLIRRALDGIAHVTERGATKAGRADLMWIEITETNRNGV